MNTAERIQAKIEYNEKILKKQYQQVKEIEDAIEKEKEEEKKRCKRREEVRKNTYFYIENIGWVMKVPFDPRSNEMKPNEDLKLYAKAHKVKQWEIADKMGISENHLIRKLRYELAEDEINEFKKIVDELSEKRRINND